MADPVGFDYGDIGDNIDAGGGWNPGSSTGGDSGDNIDAGGGWNPATGGTPNAAITDAFNKQFGTTFTGKQLAGLAGVLGGGVAGLAGLNKPSVMKGAMGYKGGIPQLTANRTMMTAPPSVVDGRPYRPGQGGVNYGGNVTYTPKVVAPPAQPPAAPDVAAPAVPDVFTPTAAAQGGLMGFAHGGKYLQGNTDGMADKLRTSIDGNKPAALSHGEFVIPADVVSHLGNGNSDAGAKKLYSMMDKIRQARTGSKKQGKQINPDKFMPGGLAYAEGGSVPAGTLGTEQTLAGWTGDYIPNMLGQGQALANAPYQQYGGQLTAGASDLQNKAFQGLGSVNFPQNLGQSFSSTGAYAPPQMNMGGNQQPLGTGGNQPPNGLNYNTQYSDGPGMLPPNQGIAANYMNPYLQSVLDPQLAELRRTSQMNLQPGLAKLTQAGGYGGGRQAIMESEANRNLLQEQNKTIGQGYASAYDKGMQQFNTEQNQGKDLVNMFETAGGMQRGIESEGIAADKAAFTEARDNPYKMIQFQQSLLNGLPISAQNYQTAGASALTDVASGMTTVDKLLATLGLSPSQTGAAPAKKIG